MGVALSKGVRDALRGLAARSPYLPNPNGITLLSLLSAGAGLVLFLEGSEAYPWLFLLAFVLDAVDGAVARAAGKESPFGAFLDGTLDRLVEGLALLTVGLMGYWLEAFLLFLFGSCLTSFVKAYALSKGLREPSPTLLPRYGRVALIALFLFTKAPLLLYVAVAGAVASVAVLLFKAWWEQGRL